MILQIKRGNKVVAESADFSYSPSLQEVRKLTCEVVSVVPIEFKTYNSKSESEYDTVVYNGNTFILYQAPSGDNLNEAGKYKYSLLFYGKEVLLQNVAFLDIVSGTGGEINKIRYTHGGLFQFWGDAKQLAARIEANIESYNASLGAGYTGIGTWTLNVDAEGELTEDMIDITDGTNLFEALKNFYDKFYLNYYFSTTANGGIITITDKTRPSVNWTFKQGDGGGAVKVSSSVDTSTPVITRIIPQGGSRNVPPEYKKDAKPADESRYCPYILLPNDSDGNIRYYIDSEYGLKNYGVRGKTISNTFSGIYPSIRGKKLGDLYPSGLPEWDTYKADGEPDPQSGKVAGEGASAATRIDKIIGSTPIKSDDSDSFFIYMTSPGFNLGYKVYEDGDSSDKINDNVQPQYKPHAMFDKYRDFESFDIYSTRAYYDQPVKVTATFSGKMLFSILPIGSDAVGKKVKINLRMVTNRVLGQASPLKEVVIGEEGATGMLEIPYDKTALVGYIEKGQNTTVTIRVEFTFDSDVPAGSCKIGFSEEMTCNIHFGNQDGSQDRFYYKYASVTDAVFSMRTGTYTGTEFKINKNGIIPLYGEVNGDTGETEEDVAMFNKGARYKISCYRTDSDNAKLPLYTDGKSPSITEGTEFVILNIIMPESYVTMAENTLEKAALDYLSRYDHENRTVSLDISSGFVAEHPNLFIDFIEGNMLKVRDDGIGVFDFSDNGQIVDMQLQIQSLEIKYSKDNMFPSYSCTIARRKILSFYERLAQENQTASTQNTTNVTLGGSGTGSGTGTGSGSGGGGDVTNADHANSAYTLDEDTPVQNWFLSALKDDDAQGIINFLKGLKIAGNLINRIVKQGDKNVTYTNEDVMSALRVMTEIENSEEKLKEIFLRKDVADSTKHLLSLLGGVSIKKYAKFGDFIDSMIAGKGAGIYPDGRGQFERLEVRGSAVFKEIIYNRLNAQEGDTSYSENGVIESVALESDGTYTLKLRKRWENDFTAFQEGDIVYGIVNNLFSTGEYYASWMRVLSKNVPANSISVLSYPDSEVPGGKNYPPTELTIITRRGNAFNEDRQSYWYLSATTDKCLVWLEGVTKPVLEQNNYYMILGRLPNLDLFDNLPVNYKHSYIFARAGIFGELYRVDWQGLPVQELVDRGFWSAEVASSDNPYTNTQERADTVWHYGCKWKCLMTGTADEPQYAAAGWAMLEGNPEFTIGIGSTKGWYFDIETFSTTLYITGKLYNRDVTDHILDADVSWTRDTGNVSEDNAWAVKRAGAGKNLPLTIDDLGPNYTNMRVCTFKAQALLRDGQQFEVAENFVTF
nr:MAG: Prophage endopeptidase tail [Bacteriophage sp.]